MQQKNVDDETIAQDIASKLKDTPAVAYSDIANKAQQCGRTELAIRVRCHYRLLQLSLCELSSTTTIAR